MNTILNSILDMDKKARKQAEEAEEAKKKAFDELSSLRTGLIAERIALAQKTVEEIRAREFGKAEKQFAELRQKNEAVFARLDTAYAENRDNWIEEIYKHVIE